MNDFYQTIDMIATGERIKQLREMKGISVEHLQEFLGFSSKQAIYRWQRGETLPTTDNLFALAGYFDISMDEILVGNHQEIGRAHV